jgi:putative ABC transport system substrate-binding protein
LEVSPLGGPNARDIEQTVTEFAGGSNRGLITAGSPLSINNRELIISLAARHRLPAVYPARFFVTEGGLISYGPDTVDLNRHSAGYVDRILKGEKPADLPVQSPTKFELVINLKTAKALGLTVPPSLLSRADEIIE